MDFSISEEDRMLQQSVKDFVENSANAVWREIEKTNALPDKLIAEAKELGLLGLSIPEQYGGVGFSVVQKALVHEMLGRGPWGLSTYISVHTGIGCVGIVRFGSEAAEEEVPAEDGERRVDRLVRADRAERGLRRRRDDQHAPCARATSGS